MTFFLNDRMELEQEPAGETPVPQDNRLLWLRRAIAAKRRRYVIRATVYSFLIFNPNGKNIIVRCILVNFFKKYRMELEQEQGGHPATSSETLVQQDDRQVLGPQAMEIRYCNSIGFVHGLPYSTLFSSSVD
jgi:hypothetical protein